MARDLSPAARALLALEAIQNSPGITAQRLGDRLGVTERAARRYVAILREADLPIDSVSGPLGGYRVGRGLRLPPLMFSAAEAMGLVMAVLEGHRYAADPADLVGAALAKILRALPARVAGQVVAVRELSARAQAGPTSARRTPAGPAQAGPAMVNPAAADPELTSQLIDASSAGRRLRITYRMGKPPDAVMDVDPWAVVLRHSLWYLLGWSHARQARRVLRVDRIVAAQAMAEQFTPPPDLDALRTLEEHLSQGWPYQVDVLIEAPVAQAARWVPRSLGRLEPDEHGGTRLTATTGNPYWYVRQLAAIEAPFAVIGSPELKRAIAGLGRCLIEAAGAGEPRS